SPTDEFLARQGGYVPRYQIIYESQLRPCPPGTLEPADVFKAIVQAGVPAIFFLNPEWICHVGYASPNIFGLTWRFTRTIANKVDIANPLKALIPGIGISVPFNLPFQFALADTEPKEITGCYRVGWEPLFNTPLVSNAIGQVFGQLVRVGKGTI